MALKVVGAGFGRTGTRSLKSALERLGFGPCHHMFEVRDNPEQLAYWQAAARGERMDWDLVFADYRAQVDWPGARYWRELSAHFADAKVILSVRDPDAWFESVQNTIAPFMNMRGSHSTADTNARAEMGFETVVVQVFGGQLNDREAAIRIFRDHIAEVQAEIPESRLLTYEVGEGWGPLCRFLEVDVPDTPFPKTNTTQEFHERTRQRELEAKMKQDARSSNS